MVAALIYIAKRKFYERKASDLRYTNPSKWFKYIYSLCGAQQLSKTPTTRNKAELQKTVDLLLDAFVAPWKDREPTALSVSDVGNDLHDRPPPVPNIGQVKAMLKHVNRGKQQVLTVCLRVSLNGFTKNWHLMYTILSVPV